jgi:hypothetical protein
MRSAIRVMALTPPVSIGNVRSGSFKASHLQSDFLRHYVIIRVEKLNESPFGQRKTAIARNIAASIRAGLPPYLVPE